MPLDRDDELAGYDALLAEVPTDPELLHRWLELAGGVVGGAKYWAHAPSPPQRDFLNATEPEVLYGGAAGGGKSDALLMDALRDVHVPGYNALILRRTYRDLAQAEGLLSRAQLWLRRTDARWNALEYRWEFPSGATLGFGYLDTENDKYRYQGGAYQFIGFDEVTQFSETQFRYLFSRLRRLLGSAVRLRMRAAANPGGVGHEWVKRRFLLDGTPDADDPRLRYVEVDDGLEPRRFVPARLSDNPGLDQGAYRASLAKLDPVTRRQLEDGDWDVRPEGMLFKRMPDEELVVPLSRVPELRLKVRAWDLAATAPKPGRDPDWTAGALLGLGADKRIYVLDVVRLQARPDGVEKKMRETADSDGPDVAVYHEQEPGAAGVFVAARLREEVLQDREVRAIRAVGSKLERARPLAARWEAGDVKVVEGGWNNPVLDQLAAFPQVAHDDLVDALTLAYLAVARRDQWGGATVVQFPSELARTSHWRGADSRGSAAPHLSTDYD